MQQLSADGQHAIDDIARRHGFSVDAVLSMLQSVINGNGSMAQFNHREFSGSGQWMSGGMTMVSDMFNNHLKGRVDGLCSELARLTANQPGLLQSGSFQSQNQGGQQQNNGGQPAPNGNGLNASAASLFVPPAPGTSSDWWGPSLRWPNSTGGQNDVRYAYFAQARRLAIQVFGKVTIYDTQDHQIGGFSQQQSHGGSLSFNSQYGLIDVASLPVVSVDGVAPMVAETVQQAPSMAPPAPPAFAPAQQRVVQAMGDGDIFVMIEKLADLRGRALLSEEEFVAKKAELLARL
ncbi:MAG: SHOCT domain-containing protein [Massilia sp.]|nr:SHOCT domain-containing protein [Massilia sp.]